MTQLDQNWNGAGQVGSRLPSGEPNLRPKKGQMSLVGLGHAPKERCFGASYDNERIADIAGATCILQCVSLTTSKDAIFV